MATFFPVNGGTPIQSPFTAKQKNARRPAAGENSRFDAVALSMEPSGDHRLRKDLVAHLSQEVRSAVTTGDIQELRRQVDAHEYKPDSAEIAARMLLMRGAE